ncbi:hypothetical protein [Puniceicoccus vermicola]|uniref:Uncharacterized protein n=1 Tax=Puniceicoccus vermicola TaxID=388746 RepID=A0A7X1AYJ4_9BACT|nr:hypothetical protein [Puniceicoccus vermicola]MBC2601200.1 hypothetical protein [Puniceicoccus vermicola]
MAEPVSQPHSRRPIIRAIHAPLGFYVLALLIVEVFLASVLMAVDLPADLKATTLYAGIGLFVLVLLVVSVLVWKKPENLIYDKEAYLQEEE